MKLTSIQKMIASAVLIVIAAVMVVAFVIVPQFARVAELEQQRAAAESRRQQAQAVLNQLEEAKKRAAFTDASLLKIGTQMPDSPQMPTLIMELQDIANAAGVDVTRLSPTQPTPVAGGQFTEISMALNATAKWDDLLDYLRRLNKSTRLLRVTSIALTPPASDEGTKTVKNPPLGLSLTLKAYVIGANGVVSAASATSTGAPAAPAQ